MQQILLNSILENRTMLCTYFVTPTTFSNWTEMVVTNLVHNNKSIDQDLHS